MPTERETEPAGFPVVCPEPWKGSQNEPAPTATVVRDGLPVRLLGRANLSFRALSWLLVLCLAGCGTLPGGRKWGQDATLLPGWHRIGQAAVNAVTDPYTWVPAAGAAVFGIGNFDRRVSDWAREHHPVYGSRSRALSMSTDLVSVSRIAGVTTAVLTPSGDEPWGFLWSKAKGLAVEYAAVGAAGGATSGLKDLTRRQRPDGSGNGSFPSGHTTYAASWSSLGRRNLESIAMPGLLRGTLDVGFAGLTAGTAWARVEGGKHYPSDVLAGAALANLITGFVHDAFLGLEPGAPALTVEPAERGVVAALRIPF